MYDEHKHRHQSQTVVKELSNLAGCEFNVGEQRFISAGLDASHNNAVLKEMLDRFQEAIHANDFTDPKDVKDFVNGKKTTLQPSKLTLGEYTKQLIQRWKDGEFATASSNYQLYNTLYNTLVKQSKSPLPGQKKLLNILLIAISDEDFQAFGEWIIKACDGKNYKNMMQTFHATIERAERDNIRKNNLEYRFRRQTPRKKPKSNVKEPQTLTDEHYRQLRNLDTACIPLKRTDGESIKRVYKDTLVLMYSLTTRPIDIISMRWSDIHDMNGRLYWVYTPKKKSNTLTLNHNAKKDQQAYSPISEEALQIIERYRGTSKTDFVLPYNLNYEDYDVNNPKEYLARYTKIKAIEKRLNQFFNKVSKHFNWGYRIYSYKLRHTAITDLERDGIPTQYIAIMAGTSEKMIVNHYEDRSKLISDIEKFRFNDKRKPANEKIPANHSKRLFSAHLKHSRPLFGITPHREGLNFPKKNSKQTKKMVICP